MSYAIILASMNTNVSKLSQFGFPGSSTNANVSGVRRTPRKTLLETKNPCTVGDALIGNEIYLDDAADTG